MIIEKTADAILEHLDKGRTSCGGSIPDRRYPEEAVHSKEVPDEDRTIALHAPSIGCDENQQSVENMKKTFMTNSEKGEEGIEIDRSPGLCIDNEHSVGGRVCADDRVVRCDILGERCRTHDCVTEKIRVTTQQWKWKEKQKSFGYVSVKQTKLLCSARIRGSTAPVIPTRTRPATTTTHMGRQQTGRLGDYYHLEQIITHVAR